MGCTALDGTGSTATSDVWIPDDLRWRLSGNWNPRNWFKGFIRAKEFLRSIPQSPSALYSLPEVTLELEIPGKSSGSVGETPKVLSYASWWPQVYGIISQLSLTHPFFGNPMILHPPIGTSECRIWGNLGCLLQARCSPWYWSEANFGPDQSLRPHFP